MGRWNSSPGRHFANEGIGREQHAVVEEDIVNPHDALVAQLDVIRVGRSPVHGQAEGEVRIMIQVGPGGDQPVHEPRFHQGNETAHAEPRWRHSAGEGHSHRDVGLEHPLGEELAAFPQPAGVVCQEGVVDQLGHRLFAGGGLGIDPLAAQIRR